MTIFDNKYMWIFIFFYLLTGAVEFCRRNFFSIEFERRRYIDVDLLKSSWDSFDPNTVDGWDGRNVLLEDEEEFLVFVEEFREEFIDDTRISSTFWKKKISSSWSFLYALVSRVHWTNRTNEEQCNSVFEIVGYG